jgi:hypothetical protein
MVSILTVMNRKELDHSTVEFAVLRYPEDGNGWQLGSLRGSQAGVVCVKAGKAADCQRDSGLQ